MPKTLIISSDSPDEDMQAAFTIVKEAEIDARLDKIVWYSNMGRSLVRYDERITALEKNFATFVEAYNRFGIDAKRDFERLFRLEKMIMEIRRPTKDCVKELVKGSSKDITKEPKE